MANSYSRHIPRARFVRSCSLIAALLMLLAAATPAPASTVGVPMPSGAPAPDGPPGLPFIEDFSDTLLQDPQLTNANWSTEEEALLLAWREKQFGALGPGLSGADITADNDGTLSVALGDMDGDGYLDVVAGNFAQPNRLYLNNGTADPFNAVSGTDIGADADATFSVALGDVDGDGDLDVVAGNRGQPNRLYLNNGTADPFAGVAGANITGDLHDTFAIALGDMDGDGDLDVVVGNARLPNAQPNRLYLNNGTANPFSGVSGTDITADAQSTLALALGDVDGDGHLDVVAGNDAGQPNRLYLNSGTADPFGGVSGSDITGDGDDTFSVALGDMDGDGDLDVVAGNFFGQPNRLYLNNGAADPFVGIAGVDITSDAQQTRSVALGDVDGDGDLDVVAANFNGQPNRLYLNNGSVVPFAGVAGADITDDADWTTTVALGDVDGDDNVDVVAGSYSAPNRLYLNNGAASPFVGVTGANITDDAHLTISVALGDVDGDGDLDVVVGNFLGQPNLLYRNNGTADPFNGVAGTVISSDANDTYALVLGDMDGDGDLDVVAGNYNGQPNRLYLNNGTADPFAGVVGANISGDMDNTYSLALGDVDGDGDLDVVAGNYDGQPNRLYLNNGTANPFAGVTGADISADAHDTFPIALGDMDGDGDLDVVAGNDGQPNRLYLNNGTAAPFNGVSGMDISADADATFSLALGDMDGDGDLDVVAGNFSGQPNRLYLNNGTAAPFAGVAGANITADLDDTYSLALGDVDGDGDLDLVVGVYFNQPNRLYLNNGTADPFDEVAGTDVSDDGQNTTSVALGDVDGDGDLDLVAGNDSQSNRLYLNSGYPDPVVGWAGEDITADALVTAAIALGDVDGDGDLDVAVGNNSQPDRLYLNNGTATPFAGVDGMAIGADALSTFALALGDVDGDGDLDLVVGKPNLPNRLFLNNGTAAPFNGVTGTDITADDDGTFAVALGDMDGDGHLDVVAGNYDGQTNRLYLNNGTADPFGGVTGSDITADVHNTFAVALGDVDGDGDLDVVAGNFGSQPNRLYLNNGTADPFDGVTGADISADAQQTRSVALGDLDGDGDLDVVAGNYSGQPNRLYLNNGTADPFAAVSGTDISVDADWTSSVALGDMDGDGDLDMVAGNYNSQTNRLYRNNGTASPFAAAAGADISVDAHLTTASALGDMDGDGVLDLVVGNHAVPNRLYQRRLYNTERGRAGSLRVDSETDPIANATLTAAETLPLSQSSVDLAGNTAVIYWLSNNGGAQWFQVRSGVNFVFPTTGTDLRWRADLRSLSPVRTPRVDQLQIDQVCVYDVNSSGSVDIEDVQLVAGAFGDDVPAYDFNHNGLVDVLDIQAVAERWGLDC